MSISRITFKKSKRRGTRDILRGKSRDIDPQPQRIKKDKDTKDSSEIEKITEPLERAAERCPYCKSKDFVKRGVRKNKHQEVQLYVCRDIGCGRTFTSRTIKGKQFPWPVVLDAISYHNLGYTFPQVSKILESKLGYSPTSDTIASWYEEYKPLCRFERLRPYAMKILAAWRSQAAKRHAADVARRSHSGVRAGAMSGTGKSSTAGNVGTGADTFHMVETTTLAHRQLYRFRYHRPKLVLALEEYKNRNFGRLMEYFDTIATETPHQYFQDGERMSEIRSKFDKTDMIVRGKENFANQFTKFILQGVPQNKDRHEVLQRFMIANDSVTVATEVPVYIRREDVEHMEQVLKFKVVGEDGILLKGKKQFRQEKNAKRTKKSALRPQPFPHLLTGHIDVVQVRNGIVHILDYKPNADKEKPIEQLTWYALALSRLTGLRLFEFKCAWFDEHNYFEFYPLHVVKKMDRKRTKKVRYRDGKIATIPRDDELHIIR